MLPTHIITGLVIVFPFIYMFQDYTTAIVLVSVLGSFLPDIDMFFGKHRKTLHFPVYSVILLLFLIMISLFYYSLWNILLFVFLISYIIHVIGDIAGSGWEKEPWEQREERVVYDHINEQWIRAKRYIDYDGSKKDAIVLLIGAVTLISVTTVFSVYNLLLYSIIISCIVSGVIYTAFRKTVFSPVYMEENYPRINTISEYFRNRLN